MTDEFVDFYEILELPLDADRSEVRKRISEIYIEAQRNLDHRNFNTRVHYQQLFEIILPQARYILLDEGRRDDYDRLVRASRGLAGDTRGTSAAPGATAGAAAGAATASQKSPQTTEIGQGNSGFKKSPTGAAGEAPRIDALPETEVDPQQLEREREELWNKWKRGLQSTMEREAAREKARDDKPSGAATTPLADRIEAAQTGAPQPQFAPGEPKAPGATPRPASSARPQRPRVKFDFGNDAEKVQQTNTPAPTAAPASPASNAGNAGVGEPRTSGPASGPTPQQIEEGRLNHQREVIRAELENTGLKGLLSGGALVLLPGVIAMTLFMSHYYPANKVSTLPIKSAALAWLLWLVFLGGLAFFCAQMLSRSMRRKQALELQLLPYEELMRRSRKKM